MDAQNELQKIHARYGVPEQAIREIRVLFEQYARNFLRNNQASPRPGSEPVSYKNCCDWFYPESNFTVAGLCRRCGKEKDEHNWYEQ